MYCWTRRICWMQSEEVFGVKLDSLKIVLACLAVFLFH